MAPGHTEPIPGLCLWGCAPYPGQAPTQTSPGAAAGSALLTHGASALKGVVQGSGWDVIFVNITQCTLVLFLIDAPNLLDYKHMGQVTRAIVPVPLPLHARLMQCLARACSPSSPGTNINVLPSTAARS